MATAENQAFSGGKSPLKGALLGMLAQGPSHGYELANRLERQLGPLSTVNRSSMYRMLRAMQEEGLVTSHASSEASSDRIVYSATPAARPALDAWMAWVPSLGQARSQLQAKMIVARREDLPKLMVSINHHERALFVKQAEIEAGVPPRHSLRAAMMYLVREASLQHIRGELQWLDLSRRTILDLISD